MKKFAILFLAVTATMFTTSCSNDDDVAAAPTLVGNWLLTAESEGGTAVALEGCELEQTITFTAAAGTAKVLDDDTPPCTFETTPFTYTVSGNNITLTVNSFITIVSQGVIEELTATSLRFRIISDSIEGVYDPADISVQTYTRQ